MILGRRRPQEFDALQQRIHPAESRVERLAEEMPARFVAFDLLAQRRQVAAGRAVRAPARAAGEAGRGAARADAPHARRGGGGAMAAGRRGRDRQGAGRALPARRAHRDGEGEARADDRLRRRRLAPRQGGGHARLADPRACTTTRASCRWSATRSGFRAKQKRELPGFLAPYETGERGSGDASRWDAGRELEWIIGAARAGRRGDLRPRQRPTGSATAPSSSAGARTRTRASARSSSWRRSQAGQSSRPTWRRIETESE